MTPMMYLTAFAFVGTLLIILACRAIDRHIKRSRQIGFLTGPLRTEIQRISDQPITARQPLVVIDAYQLARLVNECKSA